MHSDCLISFLTHCKNEKKGEKRIFLETCDSSCDRYKHAQQNRKTGTGKALSDLV